MEAATSRSRIVSAEAVIDRYAFSVLSTKTRPISWSAPISRSLVLRKSVTNHINLEDRSGRASSGRARNPSSAPTRQHAYTDPLNNRPDAVKIIIPRHEEKTRDPHFEFPCEGGSIL